jgi:hypothetical protein
MRLASQSYDSITSPAILDELEVVLTRPLFGASSLRVRVWLDRFLRLSHQVFPESIPANAAAVVGGDLGDVPVLNTAYAGAGDPELAATVAVARSDGGWYLVSENTRHFPPGRNVYGWEFITAHDFLPILLRRDRTPGPQS